MNNSVSVEWLHREGFPYAAVYVEDAPLVGALRFNDICALAEWQRIRERGEEHSEIVVQGRTFTSDTIEQLLHTEVPPALHAHLHERGATAMMKVEEIAIMQDVHYTQPRECVRFSSEAAARDPRLELISRRYAHPHTAVKLFQLTHLLWPIPEGTVLPLELRAAMAELAQREQTPVLEQYISRVMDKTFALAQYQNARYHAGWGIPSSNPAEYHRQLAEVQRSFGIDFRGYELRMPGQLQESSQADRAHLGYGQVIKDDPARVNEFVSFWREVPATPFGKWMEKTWEKMRQKYIPAMR